MPLERSDVESALKQKGFMESGGDHKFYTYYTSRGRKTQIFTKTSYGTGYKTLHDDLITAMAKQCKLTTKLFKDLVSCTLNRETYEQLLIDSNHVTLEVSKPNEQNKKGK